MVGCIYAVPSRGLYCSWFIGASPQLLYPGRRFVSNKTQSIHPTGRRRPRESRHTCSRQPHFRSSVLLCESFQHLLLALAPCR
jgi:hypothetical protein